MIKVIITITLMIVAMPIAGAFWGLGFGIKAERFVYPSVLILWAIIVYLVWFM